MKIFINSSHRPDGVTTINQMPNSWKDICSIVVPYRQAKRYRRANDWPVLRLPKDVPEYLSSQRQWIMENADCDYVWLMDDDLQFQYRSKDMKLKNSKKRHMNEMLDCMLYHLDEKKIPIVGISTRLGNNRVVEDYEDIVRVTRCYAINREKFINIGVNMAPFEPFLKQDFHLNLIFLKNGFKNRVIYKYAQGDKGSNTGGGCSLYRTPELMEKVAYFFEKEHTPFVVVKKKKTKGSWEGFPVDADGYVVRTDVLIYWKKAYRSSKKKSGGFTKFVKERKLLDA